MKITSLRPLTKQGGAGADSTDDSSIRGTESQDVAVESTPDRRKRFKQIGIGAGALVLILVFIALFRGWAASGHTIPRERLRIATVVEGPVRARRRRAGHRDRRREPDAVRRRARHHQLPVRAGDTVKKGQALATLESPALATNTSASARRSTASTPRSQRQEIEIRRQMLRDAGSRPTSRTCTIRAAEREMQRAQAAWDERVISERDLKPRRRRSRNRETQLRPRDAPTPTSSATASRSTCARAPGARAPGLRRREPEAPRGRAHRALAGRRHGREPRRRPRRRASPRTRRS